MADDTVFIFKTRRSMRHAVATGTVFTAVLSRPGNMAKVDPMSLMVEGENRLALLQVQESGNIVIDKSAYVNDVVALLAGLVSANPTIAPEIKAHLARFLDAMDARAVARHGYSDNAAEAAYVWRGLCPLEPPNEDVTRERPSTQKTLAQMTMQEKLMSMMAPRSGNASTD